CAIWGGNFFDYW
nr:immunoglobulin heavy chain junction region [Mus musculus]